jgi:beta-lactamase class A
MNLRRFKSIFRVVVLSYKLQEFSANKLGLQENLQYQNELKVIEHNFLKLYIRF